MPPDHGAALVEKILSEPALKSEWDSELSLMRDRINGLRTQLADRLRECEIERDFDFIQHEKGMFSYLGITTEEVHTLVNDYSIYLTDDSRINVAGINSANFDYLVDSLTEVLGE